MVPVLCLLYSVQTMAQIAYYLRYLPVLSFLKVVNLQVDELNSEQESGDKAELKTLELSFQTSDQLMLST
jgi:hypothetical protein